MLTKHAGRADHSHSLWISEEEALSCISDPRCIAREHYNPPEGGADASVGVPDEERGVIPLYDLNIMSYVSDEFRDTRFGAQAEMISGDVSRWNIARATHMHMGESRLENGRSTLWVKSGLQRG